MYLSRIRLDAANRNTLRALTAPQKFHGALESAFSGPRKRNLWRIDSLNGDLYILLLSGEIPDLSGFCRQYCRTADDAQTKQYDGLLARITAGSVWHFRLTANPVKSQKMENNRGKVLAHITADHQKEWLLTHSSRLLLRQAELVTNQRKHLDVVRTMYMMRFPDEDVSALTLQQLRGREGSRIRKVYRNASKEWGVEWNGREYDPEDFTASDKVNQALSAGHACLYGLAHAVISALGCSPALGFVHIGHECSFVYDIADLYKADITIPIAFEIAAKDTDDLSRAVRHRVRDEMTARHLLEQMVRDIKTLLAPDEPVENEKIMYLWDNKRDTVDYGKQYRAGDDI